MDLKETLKDTKKLNILYVEDSQSTRESTSIVLRDIFNEVILASDGEIGLDTYNTRKSDIDIIITDVQMPNMTGFEMIQHIRKDSPDVPIFIFSAYNESDFLFEAINYNVSGYILKPFDLFQLLKAIKTVIENINLKKHLENTVQEQIEKIREQERLIEKQSRQAAMGEIIDAVAHQWANPLTQISVLSSSMLFQNMEESLSLDEEQITEYGESILRQVKHMSETLDEFRSFFRMDKELLKVNLFELLDNTLVLVQDELRNNQIKHSIKGDKSIEVELIANEFKHVILNLISNSKYAFIDKNIINREISFEIKQKNNLISLEFSDNAGGIPENILDKVFNANITTKKTKGTGVGLYISKQIIEKIHGEINVQNNTNNGCTFTIVLKQIQNPHE